MIRTGIRKVMLFSLAMALVMVVVGSAHALQGGPDKFGYRYIDSLDRNGPDFYMMQNGDNVVGLEGKLYIGDSSLTEGYPIGFLFEFYGKKYNYVHVSGNGYLVFGASGTDYRSYPYDGQAVPSPSQPNRMLAPLWGYNNATA